MAPNVAPPSQDRSNPASRIRSSSGSEHRAATDPGHCAEAHQLGHVIEALRYVEGHRAAVPGAHIGLVLNSATPLELAGMSAAVDETFGVPMFGSPAAVTDALEQIPRDWDFVLQPSS